MSESQSNSDATYLKAQILRIPSDIRRTMLREIARDAELNSNNIQAGEIQARLEVIDEKALVSTIGETQLKILKVLCIESGLEESSGLWNETPNPNGSMVERAAHQLRQGSKTIIAALANL